VALTRPDNFNLWYVADSRTVSLGGDRIMPAGEIAEILSRFRGKREELIPILQQVQDRIGYLSDEAINEISEFINMSSSKIFGVASFYAQFRFTPVGRKKVMVCQGTACHVRGAPLVLEEIKRHLGINEGETTPDFEYSLETVACIGCCALAPCVVVDGKVEAKVTPRKVKRLFRGEKTE